jgi:MFS family permease
VASLVEDGPTDGQLYSRERNWLATLIPFNAVLSSLSTFVPLQILANGGNVVTVGLVLVVYNLAVIPAPLIWGHITDVTGSRRKVIVGACILMLASCIGMFLFPTILGLTIFYAMIAHSAGMLSPPANLLLMEKLPKEEWDRGFTSMSWYTAIGQIIGTAAAIPWVAVLPLSTFTIATTIMSLFAVILSITSIQDAKMPMERRALLFAPHAFVSRLTQLPFLFFRVPNRSDLLSLIRSARRSLTRELPVIFAASALFSASANLFFTSYTPFLESNHLSASVIFSLSLYNLTVNAVFSRLLIRRVGGKVTHSTASAALLVRALGMLAAATISVFIFGFRVALATLVVFGLTGSAYVFINVNLNTLLFRALPGGRQGSVLGVWSALNGLALLVGALASGFISLYLGYAITFFFAGVLVMLSSIVLDAHYGVGRTPLEERAPTEELL